MPGRRNRTSNSPLNVRASRTSLAPELDKRPRPAANKRKARVSAADRKSANPAVRVSKNPEPVVVPRTIVTGPFDPVLCAVVWALISFGVVMVYSASAVVAAHGGHGESTRYLERQAIFAVIGIPLMHVIARFDYHHLRRFTYPALLVTIVLLCIVAFGFGHAAGGAARWIPLGPFHIQPVEIAKVVWVCVLADSLSRKTASIRSFKIGFAPHVLGAFLLAGLVYEQPDFGSAVMLILITFFMLFAAGVRLGYLLLTLSVVVPGAIYAVAGTPYRLRRWTAFMEPFEHRQDEGYQLWESMMSFGSGGITGTGLGYSRQKLFFLPEAHTDFISAIVGEELGFIGFVGLALVFSVLVARGLRAALRSVDEFGTYLATGLTLLCGIQAVTNLAVAVGLLPTKGLVLPFISYGGSSLLMNCIALGIVLNVSRPRVSVADVSAGGARAKSAQAAGSGAKVPSVAGGVS